MLNSRAAICAAGLIARAKQVYQFNWRLQRRQCDTRICYVKAPHGLEGGRRGEGEEMGETGWMMTRKEEYEDEEEEGEMRRRIGGRRRGSGGE